MCDDILDSEISIPNYHVTRCDRNRNGGGLAFYVKDSFFSQVILSCPLNLEFVLLSVQNLTFSYKTHVSLFYCPPSSPFDIFDRLQSCLLDSNVSTFSNFVLVGDFNVNVNNSSHSLLPKLSRMLDRFSLTQAVSEPTHINHAGHTSLIDLVLISNPSTLSSCTVIPPLASSDHNGIQFSLKWKPSSRKPTKKRKVWRYNQANFELANSMLSSVNWDDLLSGCNDTDEAWKSWKTKVMEECIPQTVLPSKRNLPWMISELTKSLRARNLFYKRAKRNNSYRLWQKYKMKRNKVANQLKSAKRKFLSHLNLSDPKLFWKTVKQITKEDCRIPYIEEENGDIISDDESKAFILNTYFSLQMF